MEIVWYVCSRMRSIELENLKGEQWMEKWQIRERIRLHGSWKTLYGTLKVDNGSLLLWSHSSLNSQTIFINLIKKHFFLQHRLYGLYRRCRETFMESLPRGDANLDVTKCVSCRIWFAYSVELAFQFEAATITGYRGVTDRSISWRSSSSEPSGSQGGNRGSFKMKLGVALCTRTRNYRPFVTLWFLTSEFSSLFVWLEGYIILDDRCSRNVTEDTVLCLEGHVHKAELSPSRARMYDMMKVCKFIIFCDRMV